MSATPAYSAWHPHRLPERQNSFDSAKFFSSRPQTPLLPGEMSPRMMPRAQSLARQDSQASQAHLLPFQLEPPGAPAPARRGLHARAFSIAQRVPLPQGISLAVGVCTALAFGLSVTTLLLARHNRAMLLEATEARHDPHGALASLIYTAVLHALRTNMTGQSFETIHTDPT